MSVKKRVWDESFAATKVRLREPLWWYPAPVLISFALFAILTAHLTLSLAKRAGHPPDVVTLPAALSQEHSLWISVTPVANDLVITTATRQVFRWPLTSTDHHGIAEFKRWLTQSAHEEVQAVSVKNMISRGQMSLVIAADQTLKYSHLRPLLQIIASAGIAKYALETINPSNSTADRQISSSSHQR